MCAVVSSLSVPSVPAAALPYRWLDEHGWGQSHEKCSSQFEATRLQSGGDKAAPEIFMFDSYFPQAQVLGKHIESQRHIYAHTFLGWPLLGFTMHNGSAGPQPRKGVLNVHSSDWLIVDVLSNNLTGAALETPAVAREITRSDDPGRYGVTLSVANLNTVASHLVDGCVCACHYNSPVAHRGLECAGLCTVFAIGTASIAAVQLAPALMSNISLNKPRTYSHYNRSIREPALFSGRLDTAGSTLTEQVRKIKQYSTMGVSNIPLPWCQSLTNGWFGTYGPSVYSRYGMELPFSVDIPPPPISVLWTNMTASNLDSLTVGNLVHASITQDCQMWDKLQVGFANISQDGPLLHEADMAVSEKFIRFWKALNIMQGPPTSPQLLWPLLNYGYLNDSGLTMAIRAVVHHATHLLNQQANQELTTTDFTKTVLGALLDLSVVLVSIVALASGHADMQEWACRSVLLLTPQKWRRLLAKLLTSLTILLALILPSVFIVLGEEKSRRNNIDGSTSKVGLLAEEVSTPYAAGYGTAGQYLVVAVVSVQVSTVYSEAARILLYVNLVIAGLAAGHICLDVYWPHKQRRLLRQFAFIRRGNPADNSTATACPVPAVQT